MSEKNDKELYLNFKLVPAEDVPQLSQEKINKKPEGLSVMTSIASAKVNDAFRGIWPVTDPAVKKSLNRQWQLKVVKGIGDDKTVSQADTSWGTIPVPGCWEPYGFPI